MRHQHPAQGRSSAPARSGGQRIHAAASIVERFDDVARVHAREPNERTERCNSSRTRHLTCLVPAHAVGNKKHRMLRQKRVLIDASTQPHIGGCADCDADRRPAHPPTTTIVT